jgi:hypothetical protein
MGDRCGPCHDRRASGQPTPHAWPLAAPGSASRVAVEPCGCAVAALHDDCSVSVRDLATGRQSAAFLVGRSDGEMLLAPGGRFLAVCWCEAGPDRLEVWDTTGRRVTSLQRAAPSFALDADGTLYGLRGAGVAACPAGGKTWRPLAPGAAEALALSPQGDRLALIVSGPAEARLVDAATGQEVGRRLLVGRARALPAFSPSGGLYVAATPRDRRRVALVEVLTIRAVAEVYWPWPSVIRDVELSVSPGDGAVAAGAGAELRVWPLSGPDGSAPFAGSFQATHTSYHAFLPDGRLLRFHWQSGAVNLWPAELFRAGGRAHP